MTRIQTFIKSRKLLIAVVGLQLVLLLIVAAPRLSPRLFGDTYLLKAAPVDPIDPFRGAYVDIAYKGMPQWTEREGQVFAKLKRMDNHWQVDGVSGKKPSSGPYMSCKAVDQAISCGIESLFLSQDKAKSMEKKLAEGGGIAKVKIDGSGRAALVSLKAR